MSELNNKSCEPIVDSNRKRTIKCGPGTALPSGPGTALPNRFVDGANISPWRQAAFNRLNRSM